MLGAHIGSALSCLSLSWLQTEARVRAEVQLRCLGLKVPPAPADVKPVRNPFFATPTGEREDFDRGREANTQLVEPRHVYVNRQLSQRLFPALRVQLEHSLIEYPRPELRGQSTEVQALASVHGSVRSIVGGLVQSTFTDRGGTPLDPRDLGAGFRAAVPTLIGIHAGDSYLDRPERHLDPTMQLELAGIILDRVEASPVTLVIESAEPRFVNGLLQGMRRSPDLCKPILYCDQFAVITFFVRRDGTSSATWKTFNERIEFLPEAIDEVLADMEWFAHRGATDG